MKLIVSNESLPTEEEYRDRNTYILDIINKEPVFTCPKCGGIVYKHTDTVLTSMPPQYHAICDNCGYHTYVR